MTLICDFMGKEPMTNLDALVDAVAKVADMEARNSESIVKLSECMVLLQQSMNNYNRGMFAMLKSLSEITFVLAEKICPEVSCDAIRKVLEDIERTLSKNDNQ